MIAPGHTALGVDIAATLRLLQDGRGLDGEGRHRLIGLLRRTLVALSGRPVPRSATNDPAALIDAAVALARDAGMTGIDLATAFNAAAERNIGPTPRR